jgi:hypothetical protein
VWSHFQPMHLFEIAMVIGGTLGACIALGAYIGWRI